MMELLGYAAAVLMGGVFGLLGGGGAVLTVPVLVFFFALEGTEATRLSLGIVGVTAAVGAALYARRGEWDFRTALLFVIPNTLGVVIAREFLIPLLPESIHIGAFSLSRGSLLLFSFALVMIVAARAMLRKSAPPARTLSRSRVMAIALGVGGLAGFVGAGGGFLLVPALHRGLGLSMRIAAGTSLTLIAASSLVGFALTLSESPPVEYSTFLRLCLFAIVGIVIGATQARRFRPETLKRYFGILILLTAAALIAHTVFKTAG